MVISKSQIAELRYEFEVGCPTFNEIMEMLDTLEALYAENETLIQKCEKLSQKVKQNDAFWVRNHQLMAERDYYRDETKKLRKVADAAKPLAIRQAAHGYCTCCVPAAKKVLEALAALSSAKGLRAASDEGDKK